VVGVTGKLDSWSNHHLTHGSLWQCDGATWPSHGLPRGTPLLVVLCLEKFLESTGVEPVTSMVWANGLAGQGYQPAYYHMTRSPEKGVAP
jgi:hypothetical protein